ncbi:hypothetical protein IscW_ISCW020462 [Ixodes scapularis]|uniref:Uncharacterized protein n=1 Tax=Ixodes scapularis TaxID=6945 RepID=B7Q2E0_IXOSC|nr:hypothetical protein IscW_ISCW020462 [Ixodes scapularis]|eukprot:XP_002410736.1 hypothetical protein IscW_ISCW020462 [Ixodes scapularis]
MHQTKQLQAHCTSTVDGFSSLLYYCTVILIPWNYKGSEVNIHGAIDVAGLHNASWDASHIDMHLDGGTLPFMVTFLCHCTVLTTVSLLCAVVTLKLLHNSHACQPPRCLMRLLDGRLGSLLLVGDFKLADRQTEMAQLTEDASPVVERTVSQFSFMLKRKYETSWDRPTVAVVITTLIIFWLPSSPLKITLGGVSLLLTTFLIDSVTKEFTGSSNVPPIGAFLRSLGGSRTLLTVTA